MFKSTVLAAIAEEKTSTMQSLGVTTLDPKQRMTIQRNVAQNLFNAESQEVKDQVMRAVEEKKRELKAKREEEEEVLDDGSAIDSQEGDRSPSDYEKYVPCATFVHNHDSPIRRAIQVFPFAFHEDLESWAEATGWTFFTMACGPKPSAGGALYMQQ